MQKKKLLKFKREKPIYQQTKELLLLKWQKKTK